jgi:hypothetical protein
MGCDQCVNIRRCAGFTPNLKETKMGKFQTPNELKLQHNYLDVLNGYNLGKLEAALDGVFAADKSIGSLRPAALPNTEGFNPTDPLVRIKAIKAALNTAAKLIIDLQEDTREVAGIPHNPLKGGK